MPDARPTIVPVACPFCACGHTWVTYRGHSTASLCCPECDQAWGVEVDKIPALRDVPLTRPLDPF